jgi:hypothetical protein
LRAIEVCLQGLRSYWGYPSAGWKFIGRVFMLDEGSSSSQSLQTLETLPLTATEKPRNHA